MTALAVTPTPTPAADATLSSPTPPSTPPTPPTPEPWRAGPNAPAWAAGKTGEEILSITQQLAAVVEQQNRNAPPANLQPANQIYQQQQQAAPQFADDDYLTGKQVRQFAEAERQRSQQPFDQLAQNTSGLALTLMQDRYKDQFKRYGPEIHAQLANVPRNQWTVDNIETVVNFVRGRHIEDEIRDRVAAERTQILSNIPPTMRPTGGAGSANQSPIPGSPSVQDESIPLAWRQRAEQAGLTDATVDEFCRANGQTREQFFKQFDKPMGMIVEDVRVNQPRSV